MRWGPGAWRYWSQLARDPGQCVVALQQFRHGLRGWRSARAADKQVRWLVAKLLPEALGLLQARGSAIESDDPSA